MQKYIDQSISVNTTYNPQHFPGEKIPMDKMIEDLVVFYKNGGKCLYYLNTLDSAGEEDVSKVEEIVEIEDEDCSSCKI